MHFGINGIRTVLGPALGFFCCLAAGPASSDNIASTCAATTVNSAADNTCYTITPTLIDPVGIAIDGVEEAAWAQAQTKDLVGDFTGELKMMRAGDDLYVLIRAFDVTPATSDQIRFYIDPFHNHASTADDIEFTVARDMGAGLVLTKESSTTSGTWDPSVLVSDVGQVPSNNTSTEWVVEMRLSAAEFGLSDQPPIMSFGVDAADTIADEISTWPENFNSADPTNSWANVKMRYPVDYMIVLDHSGSMLSQDKWDDAKLAANFLANTMAIFRDDDYFIDRIGLVLFSTLCSGGEQTATEIPLTQVEESPGDYTAALIDPLSNNCTPIADGLREAFAASNLDATQDVASAEVQRGVLLLSDGKHNRPSSTFVPSDTTYQACSNTLSDVCADSNVQVDTVAFGNGGGFVDVGLLTEIKNHYAGRANSEFHLIGTGPGLIQPFITSLENFFRLNLIAGGGLPANFAINPNEHRVAVLHAWNTPANAHQLKLQLGGIDQPDANCPVPDMTLGLAYCVIDNPEGGVNWAAVRASDGAASSATMEFVLVDLTLRARFSMDRVVHGTDTDIILTAELRDGGRPLLNDPGNHPVTVTVDIETPEEGFGTFASTHEVRTCEVIDPTLPPLDPQLLQIRTPPQVGTANAGDPPQPHFALMASLLRACDKDALDRGEDPGLEMRDDGTQGDAVADDGIYTLRFTATDTEGTYSFRFRAEGTTESGAAFTRTKSFAEYVRVDVAPDQTAVDNRDIQILDTQVIREYNLLPRGSAGQYLGPGHADQVNFFAAGGTWLGPVRDYNNGYYARILAFDPRRGEPVVTPVVQGQPIIPAVKPDDPKDWMDHYAPWWWICLIVIVVLLILILMLWLRVQQLKDRLHP